MSNNDFSSIPKANYSTGTMNQGQSIQHQWRLNAHYCSRPSADYDLQIVCWNYWSDNIIGWLETLGRDLDTYQECCSTKTDISNVLTSQHGCDTLLCFTNNVGLAKDWESCLKKQTRKRVDELKKNNGTLSGTRSHNATFSDPDKVVGRCEMIDFAMLKGGAKPLSEVSKTGGTEGRWTVGVGVWSLVLATIAVEALAWGL